LKKLLIFVVVTMVLAVAMRAPVLAAGGQTGAVNGMIVDEHGTPLSGAMVQLFSGAGRYEQRTDARGFFTFLGVDVDTYTLSVQLQGFEPFSQPGLTIQGGSTVALGKIAIQRRLKTIARTVTRTGGAFSPNQTIPQFTVSGAGVEAALGKKANPNETALLLSVPGFQLSSTGDLLLNGSFRDQIQYQIDGVDFTDSGFHQSLNLRTFNGISSVQVVPGAGDPTQGNAGAGVVNLVVKRGATPAYGTVDLEADTFPYYHQFNAEYGFAIDKGRLSNYTSFVGTRSGEQYGPLGVSAFQNGTLFSINNVQTLSFDSENDFINNLVYRFGKTQNQSLQFLYQRHDDQRIGNYGGLPLRYPSSSPDLEPLLLSVSGLTEPQLWSVISYEHSQTSPKQEVVDQSISTDQDQILKFEYDNQFDAKTYLAARFFHSNGIYYTNPSGPTILGVQQITGLPQTQGGNRTGGNFELSRQLSDKHLVTVSGNYSFNTPISDIIAPYIGVFDIGPNSIDFLRPPNPNMPVNAVSNPCPVANGCYLQQFFYAQGGTPRIPPVDLRYNFPQQQFGFGIRDQYQVNTRLRLDFGIREDGVNQHIDNLANYNERTTPNPANPLAPYISNFSFIQFPRFTEPRVGASYRLTPHDSMAATYGQSIILEEPGNLASPENADAYRAFANVPVNPNWMPTGNPFTGVTSLGGMNTAVGNDNCFFNLYSHVDPVTKAVILGRPCRSYAEVLYAANDAFFPEVSPVQPGLFSNYDFNYSHQFANGAAFKIAPFYRKGVDVLAVTAPLVFVPSSGTYSPGSSTNQSVGVSTTSGIDFQFTLPDRPRGFSGFLSATYVNELTNTPPQSDNPNIQDNAPAILPASLAARNIYRAGFISPFTIRAGPVYKTMSGLRINPVLNWNIGFPYGVGLLTPVIYNGHGINVPQTNFTDQYGPPGATQYVDPANPGSIFSPVIAATRGTPERPSGGGNLTSPRASADLTVQYSPPRTHSTFGVQVLNVFGNVYGLPQINGNYQPVVTGVPGPVTGQSQLGAAFPKLAPFTLSSLAFPRSPYIIPPNQLGTVFRLYYQASL